MKCSTELQYARESLLHEALAHLKTIRWKIFKFLGLGLGVGMLNEPVRLRITLTIEFVQQKCQRLAGES